MELKELLRVLSDGKGKLKITGFPKDHIVDIEKMDAESMGRAIKNHDCYRLYTELTPKDILGVIWENGSDITEFYYVKSRDAYGAYCDKKALYTAKEIQEQFTRWEDSTNE